MSKTYYKEIGVGELIKYLNIFWESGVTPFIIGPPGIGKSDIVRQFAKMKAKELGRKYVEWEDVESDENLYRQVMEEPGKYFVLVDRKLREYEPYELKGLLFPEKERGVAELLPLDWMKLFTHPDSAGILFLDELNMAESQTIAAALQIVYQKIVGGKKLRGKVMIIAAGNPKDYNILASDLPAPLVNRVAILHVEPDFESWMRWAVKNKIHPLIIEFLQTFKDYLFHIPENYSSGLMPITTPRSWELLSRSIYSVERLYKDMNSRIKTIETLAYSLIGPDIAARFVNFVKYIKVYKNKVKKYIENPYLLDELADNPEELVAVIHCLANEFIEGKYNDKKFIEIAKVLSRISGEMAVIYVAKTLTYLKNDEKGARLLDLISTELPEIYDVVFRMYLE